MSYIVKQICNTFKILHHRHLRGKGEYRDVLVSLLNEMVKHNIVVPEDYGKVINAIDDNNSEH